MNYFGMPFGMWTLLAKSFRTQLTKIFGYNDESARDITHKAKAQYKEITEVPLVCLCSCKHPLVGRSEVSLEELRNEKLVLLVPAKATISIAQMQGRLMGERPPSEFYFCESAEAITVLVTAGYGVSVLPDSLVPDSPLIAKIPLKDTAPMSFGIYYKTVQDNPALKAFIQCVKDNFANEG